MRIGLPPIVWWAEGDWPSSLFTSGSFLGEELSIPQGLPHTKKFVIHVVFTKRGRSKHVIHSSRTVVPKRLVATPWCVGRDHEVCREIKKKYLN
jgi:hypothetical protein